ncbi:MAG: lamin tail domain-containing protein [Candidatus Bipolaricaulota bacterium]|nr:lamin tail domain-containing protein [Candidatus Bipolaricaulota bacterium]
MRTLPVVILVVVPCLALALIPVAVAGQSAFPLLKTYQLGAANYDSRISGVSLYPADGRYLVVSGREYQGFSVVDTQSWSMVAGLESGFASWISFSPDWARAALYEGVFETGTWHKLWGFGGSQGLLNSVNWQPFSPDGALLVCPGKPITLWDVATGCLEQKLYLREERIPMTLMFTDDGSEVFAAWSSDNVIEIAAWDALTGAPLPSIVTSIRIATLMGLLGGTPGTFSADGHLLAVRDGDSIWLADTATGATVGSFSAEQAGDFIAGFSFVDGSKLLASGTSREVALFSVPSGRRVATFAGDPSGLSAFGVSSDGKRLAVGGRSGRVDVYDISALGSYSCSGFRISKVDCDKGCVTIKNTTTEPLDLLGWKISDGDKSFAFPTSLVVEPGATYVVCPSVYNSSGSSRGLTIDETDEEISLYSPEICGGSRESRKSQ